ncbi:MAG: dihydropteroate synthase [Alphaproteobacteria bacterium]|nr:dihydropteroate synthase [Alphaproteobacteria bacterium]
MGILNVTPDSFSDGGAHAGVQPAVDAALAMLEAGADVIDVGGESTRPGAAPVPAAEEIARVAPVIERLRARTTAPIAVDTMKPEVARAAFAAGATIWNDVTALAYAPDSVVTAAELGATVILMHMQGEPRTMQANPVYEDVVADVAAFLEERADIAEAAGVKPERIWVDPGLGFGKTLGHNLDLVRGLPHIRARTQRRVVFGASRKSFIGTLDGGAGAQDRLGGSLSAALAAWEFGADMLRVHDVRETVQALRVWLAIGAES